MKNGGSEPLRFKGGPTRLSAALRLPGPAIRARSVNVDFNGVTGRVVIRPMARTGTDISVLKIKLPRTTPPGTYEGTVQVGDSEVPIVAHVEPRPRLRFIPAALRTKAAPGSMVDADVTVANVGNVVVNVDTKYTFCIYDGTGIERAFFVALTDENAKGQQRIDLIMEELAESHGGLVRLIVERGAGEIAPGEARDLHIALRFSDKLHPGRTYDGGWTVGNASYFVQIEVTDKQHQEEEIR